VPVPLLYVGECEDARVGVGDAVEHRKMGIGTQLLPGWSPDDERPDDVKGGVLIAVVVPAVVPMPDEERTVVRLAQLIDREHEPGTSAKPRAIGIPPQATKEGNIKREPRCAPAAGR